MTIKQMVINEQNLFRLGTDVHSALMNGIDQLTKKHDSKRALALLFLTDGQANVGMYIKQLCFWQV